MQGAIVQLYNRLIVDPDVAPEGPLLFVADTLPQAS